MICNPLRCNAISRLSASVRHFCIGTQNLRWYVLRVVNLRWNAERRATPPTYAVRFLVSVETYDRRLALLSTHRLRTNATPHSASTINAVWFCVFRWNAHNGRLARLQSMYGFRSNVEPAVCDSWPLIQYLTHGNYRPNVIVDVIQDNMFTVRKKLRYHETRNTMSSPELSKPHSK